MTTIALNRLTTDVPARWQHLPLVDVRHFDWSGLGANVPCDFCAQPLNQHAWRVYDTTGTVIDCAVTS